MSNSKKRKSFLSILEESNNLNGYHPEEEREEEAYEESDDLPLSDDLDHLILMHREAHFGGDFATMIAYYEEDHLGIQPDFDLDRLDYLAQVEEELKQNLAPLLLTGPEIEKIAQSRKAYLNLKEVYEQSSPPLFAKLLADLILSEEEEPLEEIEAVVTQDSKIVPELIHILQSDDFFDPLFPGYGYAPYLAAICLGQIGDPAAIIPLFETLGKELYFDEEVIVEALFEIGEEAQDFLLKILKSRPLTEDNVKAAFALTIFSADLKVAEAAFEQLKDPVVHERPLLSTYLVCSCDPLQHSLHKTSLIKMAKDLTFPFEVRMEIENLVKSWK